MVNVEFYIDDWLKNNEKLIYVILLLFSESEIQKSTHCSVEDAQHTMQLYLLVQQEHEAELVASTVLQSG